MGSDDAARLIDTVPPQDLEAEQAVLSAVLLSGNGLVAQLDDAGLTPEDFYRVGHGAIYQAMRDVHRAGDGTSLLTVRAHLRKAGLLDELGGLLESLDGGTWDLGNLRSHARIVRDLAFARRRREALLRALESGSQEHWDALAALADEPADGSDDGRKYDIAELLRAADTEPPWRCEGLAADGHVTVLAGRGGEGKSMLTLGLAGAVQSGSALAGVECKPGKVVMFDAENGEYVLGSRLKQIVGMPFDQIEIWNAEGRNLAHQRAWFAARAAGAQLVIFDSLRTLAPTAKENDSDDMAPVMGTIQHVARSTGAAVIVIHHRGKGELDFRGSSAIRDQTDMLFVLERDDKDPERTRRQLRCVKCRIYQEPEPRWLTIKHAIGEIFFTEAAPFELEAPAAPVREQFEEAIPQILADRGPLSRPELSQILDTNSKGTPFRDAIKNLVADGVVVEINPGKKLMLAPGRLDMDGVGGGATPGDTGDTSSLPEEVSPRARVKGADTSTPPSGEAS